MYYVAHRLFALHDRALAALVASELARRVGEDAVFLPFCDTDEEALVSACKGRALFELDRQRLSGLTGMIAIIHGPSIDDGVCMEIGYACRMDVPVVLLTTDFQTYGLSEGGPELAFPDPLLETVTECVVRVSRLGAARTSLENRFAVFLRQNLDPLQQAVESAIDRLLSCSMPRAEPTRRAFLEPSPYGSPAGSWETLAQRLEVRGWEVHQAVRWQSDADTSHANVLARAYTDWATLKQAGLLVVDVNGPEAPPGAALLIGAAAATGKRILAAYEDRSFTFAQGREPNFRNLMIQYSITARSRTLDTLCQLLDN